MKKLTICILLFAIAIFARAPEPGESIDIELKSGLKQRAKFVGMHQDTVLLGGYIKNQFTVVRLAKEAFASAKSTDGELLAFEDAGEKPVVATAVDSAATDSAVVADTETAVTDSVATDSSTADSSNAQSAWENKTLFVPFARRPIDSAFTENLQSVFFALLQEENLDPIKPTAEELDGCNEPSCIIQQARQSKVAGAFFGNVSATANDSILVQLTYFTAGSVEPEEASFKVSNKTPLASIFADNDLHNALQQLFGRETTPAAKATPDTVYKNPTVHYVHIETDPEDATLAKAGGEPICRTPCTFATQDTGYIEVYAYWDVDEHLWAETTRLRIIPGDTAKASLRLKRIDPAVQVVTHPADAEIYPDQEKLTPFTSRLGKTPKILQTKMPGSASLKIKKEGYRDTTITFYVMPNEQNKVEINLTPITVPAEIKAQQEWLHKHKMKKIGITLMGASIVPLALGGVFTYLASKDYEKARDIRDELKTPHIGNGDGYKSKKEDNKKYAERGDTKLIIGVSAFGVAGALLATGIIITF